MDQSVMKIAHNIVFDNCLVGRGDLLSVVLRGVSSQSSFFLQGSVGMGKTSFLRGVFRQLAELKKSNDRAGLAVVPVMVECDSLGDHSERMFSLLLGSIRVALQGIDETCDFQIPTGEIDYHQFNQSLNAWLASILHLAVKIVIIFDDFDLAIQGLVGSRNIAGLRYMMKDDRTLGPSIRVVFASSQMLTSIKTEFGALLDWRELSPLSVADIHVLLDATGHPWSNEFSSTLYGLTGGHPGLTLLLLKGVFEDHIDQAATRLQRVACDLAAQPDSILSAWWNGLPEASRNVYKQLADGTGKKLVQLQASKSLVLTGSVWPDASGDVQMATLPLAWYRATQTLKKNLTTKADALSAPEECSGGVSTVSVFISHSWEHDSNTWVDHVANALQLMNFKVIRQAGQAPGSSVAEFLASLVSATYIVVVGTPEYKKRAVSGGREAPHVLAAEYALISQRIVERGNAAKVIPVLLSGSPGDAFPVHLGPLTYVDFRNREHQIASLLELANTLATS